MDAKRYTDALVKWLAHARMHLYEIPGQAGLKCYGTGYNTWGVQTNQKAFTAYAVLATDPNADFATARVTREEVLADALAILRFSLRSHIEGDICCTDGKKWGHTWISALGFERMMHGVEAIWQHLTDEDRDNFNKVLLSEADWLLHHYPVEAGIVDKNKPESNIWNGAILHRAALMVPDAPNADAYREKGTKFLLNGNSRACDALSDELFSGKPLKEWHLGPNYTETFGLYHHHYLNVGYMAICLSNQAMLHFTYRQRGIEAPKELYHNFKGIWELIRACTFDDGRLLRIGGDTRARYCYCQDYIIPVWLMAEDWLGQDCASLEDGWMSLVEREMAANNDGAFLSTRCESLMDASPLYYTRLESDRAVALSMAAYWHRVVDIKPTNPLPKPMNEWGCDFHGARLVRGEKRAASYVWRSAEMPAGLCLPLKRSDMAEWRYNLSGFVEGCGSFTDDSYVCHQTADFSGGFVTSGVTRVKSEGFLAEGHTTDDIGLRRLAYAALPDDKTVLCIQTASASNRVYLRSVKGLLLNMPNDLFNGCERLYEYEGEKRWLRGMFADEQLSVGNWLEIDGELGVALPAQDKLTLLRGKKRQVQIKRNGTSGLYANEGSLYCDEIITGETLDHRWFSAGDTLYDVAFAVAVDGAEGTRALAQSLRRERQGSVRLLYAAASGKRWLLAFNASDEPSAFAINDALRDVSSKGETLPGTVIELKPNAAILYELQR